MTLSELAIVVGVLSFAVLIGYLVPLLIQARGTVAEAGRMLAKLNAELPPLVSELRSIIHGVNDLIGKVRAQAEPVVMCLHTIGEVGESIRQAHRAVQHSGRSLRINVAGVTAGVRVAFHVLRNRWRWKAVPPRPSEQFVDHHEADTLSPAKAVKAVHGQGREDVEIDL